MTSTTEKPAIGAKAMSRASIVWDQAEKGYLTEAERTAKNLDVEGKGHLSREQAVSLGSQYQSLKEDNKQIKNQLYGLAVLCVLLFIGTVAGTVMAVKNSKDTIVDMKTGVMKVKDGNGGVDVVTVKAQGTKFQTTGSVMINEETTSDLGTFKNQLVGHCISSDDIASMWLANEQGTDARLVVLDQGSIEPVTNGRASWNADHIVMGGMTFSPSEECTNSNRKLLESNDINNNDTPSFDSISIHRALKERVGFLSGRHLIDRKLQSTFYSTITHTDLDVPAKVELGDAGDFVILSKTGIATVPTSTITGDIAVSPIAASAITGFNLVKDPNTETFSTDIQVTGNIYASSYSAPTPSVLTTAVGAMMIAYLDAASRTVSGDGYTNFQAGAIGGWTLGPGVYVFNTDVTITSDVMFTGSETDIFIIQTSGNLVQAAATNVVLGGNAKAENIFWSVAGFVSVGAVAHLKGILLVATYVAFVTGSSLQGRIFSQTAVTLGSATITQP
jgi:predicted ribosome-associated RNA-binding protein Tma20